MIGFVKTLFKIYRIAYTKQGRNDNRTPLERFEQYYKERIAPDLSLWDKLTFATIIQLIPTYIKITLWAFALGWLLSKIYEKYGLSKLIISATLMLFFKLHFSFLSLKLQMRELKKQG